MKQYHFESIELLNRALDMALRECGACPQHRYGLLNWDECDACYAVYSRDIKDVQQTKACWKRFFIEQAASRHCRVCGCTDLMGCFEGCYWVDEDLCSACIEKEQSDERDNI